MPLITLHISKPIRLAVNFKRYSRIHCDDKVYDYWLKNMQIYSCNVATLQECFCVALKVKYGLLCLFHAKETHS